MNGLVTLVAIALFLGALQWITYRVTNGRNLSAQWMAFSFTAGGAYVLAAGAIGYDLSRHVQGSHWSGGVIWNEVAGGAAMLAVAAVCWMIALRSYGVTRLSRS